MHSIDKRQVNMNLNFKFKTGGFLGFYLCWFLPTNKIKIFFGVSDMVLIFFKLTDGYNTEKYCNKKVKIIITRTIIKSSTSSQQNSKGHRELLDKNSSKNVLH
jgi:hypothetical protein